MTRKSNRRRNSPGILAGQPSLAEPSQTRRHTLYSRGNRRTPYPQGFISRKLLKPVEPGNYAAIVEFENHAGFKAMHSSSIHDKEGEQVRPLFDGKPTPKF